MTKLKIAIFHLAFVYSGGGEKLVLEEAIRLQKKGHDVTVFTTIFRKDECFPELIKQVDIQTFLPDLTRFLPEHESMQVLLTCVMAPFVALKFHNFDVIFAANQPSPWIAFWVKKYFDINYVSYLAQPTRFIYPRKIDLENGLVFIRNKKHSLTEYILSLAKPLANIFDRISIKGSKTVLCNGEHVYNLLKKTYDIDCVVCQAGANPAKKIISIESRIRGKVRIGRRILNKPYVLVTNRHFPQKRFEHAIIVLPHLQQSIKGLKLFITGSETEYTKGLKSLTKQLYLNDRVEYVGWVNEKDLITLYANALCYLYTAPEEDFGMGIIEAMAQGTPVVAWNNAGPKYIIKNYNTGLLAQPFNISDFTQKSNEIVTNFKLANKLGYNGWRSVKKCFTYDKHIELIEKSLIKCTKK